MKEKWIKLIEEFEQKYQTKPTYEQMKEEFNKMEKEELVDLITYLFLNIIKEEVELESKGDENGEG